jgi:hypothetical protein
MTSYINESRKTPIKRITRSVRPTMITDLTDHEISKLSHKQKVLIQILSAPDYVLKRDSVSGIVYFWFDKLICLNLKTATFSFLCEWKDSIAFTSGYSLPATIKPLSDKFSPAQVKEIDSAYIDYITEKLLLKTDTNKS